MFPINLHENPCTPSKFEGETVSSGTALEYREMDAHWYPGFFIGAGKKGEELYFEKMDGTLGCVARTAQLLRLVSVPATHEIERRFFVNHLQMLKGVDGETLTQAYLSHAGAQLTTRVRISGEGRAWLTLKGRPHGDIRGEVIGHDEFEYPIPVAHAEALIAGYSDRTIKKTRYKVPYAGHVFEVDLFDGALAGLVLAEVELDSADEVVDLPEWLGLEVTHDPQYRNVNLVITRPTDAAAFCKGMGWPLNP
jgi:adenylate cyclase